MYRLNNHASMYPTKRTATGKQYSKDEKVYAYAVVYCDGEFWIKIKSETLYSNFEYIHYSDIANKIKLAEDLIEAKDKLDKEIDTYYSGEESVRIMKSVDSKKYIEGQGFSDITSAEYVFNHNGWTFYQCAAFAGQIYCAIWDKYLRSNRQILRGYLKSV